MNKEWIKVKKIPLILGLSFSLNIIFIINIFNLTSSCKPYGYLEINEIMPPSDWLNATFPENEQITTFLPSSENSQETTFVSSSQNSEKITTFPPSSENNNNQETTFVSSSKNSEKITTFLQSSENNTTENGEKITTFLPSSTTFLSLLETTTKTNSFETKSTFPLENEKGTIKCEPTDVFIRWSEVRKYLINNLNEKIPDSLEGTSLRVRRCLYFTSSCNDSEALCLVSKEETVMRNITLTRKRQIYGYYNIFLVQHSECVCTNETANKDDMDYPWEVPFITYVNLKKN